MIIDRDIMSQMIDHCQSELPNEGCGYLAGTQDRVDTIYTMTNVDASPEHFTFDPKEQFSVVKQAREASRSLQVVYHSHPETAARLSQEDLKLLNDPSMVYIIVSFADEKPAVKGFKILKENDDIVVEHVTLKEQ